MRTMLSALTLLLATGPAQAMSLDWIDGCWQTAAGTREVWRVEAPTLAFGFSTITDGENIVWFEQSRIERTKAGWKLVIIGAEDDIATFDLDAAGATSARFQNLENPYPQIITFEREGEALKGAISMGDGSKKNTWLFKRCPA